MRVKLTDDARAVYDDYVQKVRANLACAGAAGVDDVLGDLHEHINQELAGSDEPVSRQVMEALLQRLGPPAEWVSAEDLPWWRKVLLRLRTGPDGWRLAYVSFGVLLLGIVLGWLFSDGCRGRHEFNWTVMVMFTALSWILSRAAVAAAGGNLGSAQKWLVYPSLIAVCAILTVAIIAWAPIAGGAGGFCLSYDSLRQHPAHARPLGYYPYPFKSGSALDPHDLDVRAGIFAAWAATAAAGIWWTVLAVGLLLDRPRRVAVAVFGPFLNTIRRRWVLAGLVLAVAVLAVAIVAACAAYHWGHVYV